MVHFSLLFSTSQDKKLRSYLVEEMRAQLSPLLESLSFQVFQPKHSGTKGFPTKYYRQARTRIDVIYFRWRRNGVPAFIIDFDVIDDQERFTTPAKAGSETWFNAPRFRARSNTSLVERWFHIGYLPRLGWARAAARREVMCAKARIEDIDRFATTGETSRYFRNVQQEVPPPRNYGDRH